MLFGTSVKHNEAHANLQWLTNAEVKTEGHLIVFNTLIALIEHGHI